MTGTFRGTSTSTLLSCDTTSTLLSWLVGDDKPTALRSWTRTDTSIEPVTFRGIDRATTAALASQGVRPVELSPLLSRAERKKVLEHPLLLARGDAAGIVRETGIFTSDKMVGGRWHRNKRRREKTAALASERVEGELADPKRKDRKRREATAAVLAGMAQ